MARKVFFHIGLPKTGTTYLQTLLWANREELARQGVLMPGESNRQHLWASGVVREDTRLSRRGPQAEHAWDLLVGEINSWPGTAIISHEFFASASAEQADRAAAALDGAEVHVVVTARDTLSLVTARWQEFVKNGATDPIDDYPSGEETDPADEWDWGTLDLADVLARWSASMSPAQVHERVHVLTLPGPDEPREALWLRFAELVGIDADRCGMVGAAANESLGVVEVELLRRVNAQLSGFTSPQDRGVWIRGYLAQGKLVPRGGERFWPSAQRVAYLQARGNRVADEVAAAGYDVIGDVAALRPPVVVPVRRHPDSVTDAELAEAASGVIAAMMTDVRRLTRRQGAAEPSLTARLRSRVPEPARRVLRRARAVWPAS
ncbi:MAG: hypothetical protein ABI776_12410 [Nocardioidaceae bacterium]